MGKHVLPTEFMDDRRKITGRDCVCLSNGRGRVTRYKAKCPWHSIPDRIRGSKSGKHRSSTERES